MVSKFEKKEITKKSKDFSRWYNDVVLKAELADYSPVKGCMVIKPYGFAIWENIKNALDEKIKAAGVQNAYFPLFIPYSFLKKEAEHVKGFSPELAIVTHGGGEKLSEPLVVRPTSETVMYAMFSKWIQSYRDLPLLINQWCNIVRWEKRTFLFLRTTEFLWQEGHTCHRTHDEARGEVERALKMYEDLYQDYLAIGGVAGKRSESDKFPGAVGTYAFEMLMPDGKALQGCTSHDLGQNFAKPFKIKFQDLDGKQKYVWQTCWGFTTRSIGALIMVHGDDNGLILPPKMAPIQVVIIPIPTRKKTAAAVFCQKLKKELEKVRIRVKIDDREEYTPGWKFNEWELKGVPLRIEVGEKEIEGEYVTVARRDDINSKFKIPNDKLKFQIQNLLKEIQDNLYQKARKFLEENTHKVDDYQEFKRIMKSKRGFILAFWCGKPDCEEKIKSETKASNRCLPTGGKKERGKCVYCGKPAEYRWLFAQAY